MKFTNTKAQFNTIKTDAKSAFEANLELAKSIAKIPVAIFKDWDYEAGFTDALEDFIENGNLPSNKIIITHLNRED